MMQRTTIAAVLMSLLLLVGLPMPAAAQSARRHLDFDVDHFKCYRASTEPFAPIPNVTLVDQFDRALGIEEKVEIFVFLRLCNPATKIYGGVVTRIKHPTHHLTLYHFNPLGDEKPIRGSVVVANQFGQQHLKIESARILAVPTLKVAGGDDLPSRPVIPRDLDHYKCYYATGQAPDPGVVGLIDQFETHTLSHQLREPVLFCNPVMKIVDYGNTQETYEIRHPDDHLTCYKISILTENEKPMVFYNQFFPFGTPGKARGADVLCVPSKKVAFKLGGPEFGLTTPVPGAP